MADEATEAIVAGAVKTSTASETATGDRAHGTEVTSAAKSQTTVDGGVEQRSSTPERGAEPGFSLDSFLESHGLRQEGKKSEEILSTLVDSHRERARLASIEQQLADVMPVYKRLLNERLADKKAAEATPPASKDETWWSKVDRYKPIERDTLWSDFLTRDATGELAFKENTPEEVRIAYLKAQAERGRRVEQFVDNPGDFLNPLLETVEQRMQKIIDERLERNLSQKQESSWIEHYDRSNADWLYDKNADGSFVQRLDPETGQPTKVLGPIGEIFRNFLGRAEQLGISNRQGKALYAEDMTRAYLHSLGVGGGAAGGTEAAAETKEPVHETEDERVARLASEQREKVHDQNRGEKTKRSSAGAGQQVVKRKTVQDVLRDMRSEGEAKLAGTPG